MELKNNPLLKRGAEGARGRSESPGLAIILQTVDDYRRCRRWTLWRKSWKADRMMKVFLRELWYYIIRQTIDNQKTGSTGMRPIPTGMRRKETP